MELTNIWEQIKINGPKIKDKYEDLYVDVVVKDVKNDPYNFSTIANTLMSMESRADVDRKNLFCMTYGYVVPSESMIKKISEWVSNNKILEIGSGLGLLAYLLKSAGVKITATDAGPGLYYQDFSKTWINVEILNYDKAIQKYKSDHDILLLAWPPLSDKMAYEALKLFTGTKLIYIGECFGGCCANDDFFYFINDKFVLCETIKIPNWSGIYSKMYFYTRK